MFDHMGGVMQALVMKKPQWQEDMFFAAMLAQQTLSKYYAGLTPMTGIFLISAHILAPFRKLQLFSEWDKGMDIYPEDKTCYTTQYREGFLKYVENEYCAKHRCVPINQLQTLPSSDPISSATASGSCRSSFDPYDLSSDE
jgi:hypothetical protein